MKKMLIAVLISLTFAATAYAKIVNANYPKASASCNSPIEWVIDGANDVVTINNIDTRTDVIVSVDPYRRGSSILKPGSVKVSCGSKWVLLEPSSSIVCQLYAGDTAQIQLNPGAYGASNGSYSVLRSGYF